MSTPHCSLIMYVNKDATLIPAFLRDLRSFFAKFPVYYEVIAIVEKKAQQSLLALQKEQTFPAEKERIQILQNNQHLGRARSLARGFDLAESSALLIVSPEMASPLGDILKLWQHLISEDQIDICWGDRYRKKDSPFVTSTSPRLRTEHFFNELFLGRSPLKKEKNNPEILQDPLCEVFALKKQAWEKLRRELLQENLKSWYLGVALQRCSTLKDLKIIELPVYDSGITSKSYSLWLERWRLMRRTSLRP